MKQEIFTRRVINKARYNLPHASHTMIRAETIRLEKKEVPNMIIDKIALALAIIGALNWGSIGLFSFDVVAWICGGAASIAARIIYTLVALAGVWCISLLFRPEEDTVVAEH